MRKLKPFHDFDRLTPEQLDGIHANLAESSYERTRVLLRDQFKIRITYGRLRRYYERFLQTREIKKQVGVDLTVGDYIKVQNGDALPFGAVTHHLIQKAACQKAAAGEDHTIAELLSLQRIANADFQQKLAREKLELEHRRLALRQEIARKTPAKPESDQPNEKPFRMWTEEEVRTNQPKVEAAFRAHPILRYIGLPPVDVPPTLPPDPSDPSDPSTPSTQSTQSTQSTPAEPAPESAATPPPSFPSLPSVKAPPAPAELDQLLAEARSNPKAPFDPRLLKHVTPAACSSHLSRDLSLPLEHRVTCYTYARRLEQDAGRNSDLVGRGAPQNFKSKLNWCPCGRDLPCPDHGELEPRFLEARPGATSFNRFFYDHRLPVPPLGELVQQLEKIQQSNSNQNLTPKT